MTSHSIFTRAEAKAQVQRAIAERQKRLVHHLSFESADKGRRAFVMRDPIQVRQGGVVSDSSLYIVQYRNTSTDAHRDDWIAPDRESAINAAKLYCGWTE